MTNPREAHLFAAKRVLHYVKGTVNLGVFYKRGVDEELVSLLIFMLVILTIDWIPQVMCYVFMMSNGVVSRSSRKQPVLTLSSTEAEYITAAACACQSVWMQRVVDKLGHFHCKSVTMFCNNYSTIKLSKNSVLHAKSKHIYVWFHFLRVLVKDGIIEIKFGGRSEQITDILTKPLKLETFEKLCGLLGIRSKIEY